MIGSLLIINQTHKRAAELILSSLNHSKLDKFVVAISGESGAGKSEIAHLLRKSLKDLNISSKIIHADNYYITLPTERAEWRKERGTANSVGVHEYRWELITQHINLFRHGSDSVELPFIDIVSDQIDTLITSFSLTDVLIVEGLYAINADADFRILIDITYQETRDMQILKGKETLTKFRIEVLEAEHKAVQALRDKADLIINKEILLQPDLAA